MNDFKVKEPTKMEKVMFELYQHIQTLEKNYTVLATQFTALNQITHAVIAMLEGRGEFDAAEHAKTMHNDIRMQSIRAKMMGAEMEVVNELKAKAAGATAVVPGQDNQPTELIVPK